MTWLGLLIGGIVGSSWGFKSTLLGALIGALIGMYLRKSAARASESRTAPARGGEAVRVAPSPDAAGAATGAVLPVRKGGTGGGFAQAAPEAAPATVSATPAVAPRHDVRAAGCRARHDVRTGCGVRVRIRIRCGHGSPAATR